MENPVPPPAAPLAPLPPFPVVSLYDVVAGEEFDLEGKLLPSQPEPDPTNLFFERTHGR